jgi:hypothetical protein
MQTKAAILWEVNAPWSVEDIELDDPKQGEVMVKLAASGLCHSDEHLVTGDLPFELCRGSKSATMSCSGSSHHAAVARAARPVTRTCVISVRLWAPACSRPT